jgi:hypothetical protein
VYHNQGQPGMFQFEEDPIRYSEDKMIHKIYYLLYQGTVLVHQFIHQKSLHVLKKQYLHLILSWKSVVPEYMYMRKRSSPVREKPKGYK